MERVCLRKRRLAGEDNGVTVNLTQVKRAKQAETNPASLRFLQREEGWGAGGAAAHTPASRPHQPGSEPEEQEVNLTTARATVCPKEADAVPQSPLLKREIQRASD